MRTGEVVMQRLWIVTPSVVLTIAFAASASARHPAAHATPDGFRPRIGSRTPD
jgi:hypothetical protein